MEISVLFIGHSYARRAKEDRIEKGLDPNTIYIDNLKLNFKYIFKGGQNHKFFNENLKIRNEIESLSPNIVITALAGNAVAKTSLYDIGLTCVYVYQLISVYTPAWTDLIPFFHEPF